MALLNLAVNARDAMRRGGQIIIAAHEQAVGPSNADNLKPGRYVRLSVTDTGEGMDEETLRRATEPFFTTKGVGKGTGLGLPMVNGLAEQIGGRFLLSSRVGEGTIAEIWIPTAERCATADPPSPVPTTERYYEPRVVLAVDDDPLVLTNALAMLEELGHTAIGASSGQRSLEILRDDNSIDVVVTDQVMPDMTGVELAKTIRAEWPRLSIILATGFAETPPESLALPRLAKPFTQADLGEKISLYGQAEKKGRLLRLRNVENPKA
jgi:CheY-like chemotaxis protein